MVSEVDGVVSHKNNQWHINGKAHVLFRAERAILNAKRKEDGVWIPGTGEGARDVFWFAQRYRLKIGDPAKLRSQTAAFVSSHGQAERILSGDFRPDLSAFRDGKKPREYQTQAARLWQAVKGLLIADQLGIGKTVSALSALVDPAMRPAIIVAPTHLTGQWQDVVHEFFTGIRTHVIKQLQYYDLPQYRKCEHCNTWSIQKLEHGKPVNLGVCRKCQHMLRGDCSGPDLFMVSYHKIHAWADILGPLCKSVVFDECHELRRADSRKYDAAKRISGMMENRLGLSATPCANLGGEMFNVMDCLSPGTLGTKSDFRKTWCNAYASEAGKEPALKDPAAFGEYLRSEHLMIRRTRVEVGRELPEHTRIVHNIEVDTTEIDRIRGRAGDLARLILSKSKTPGEQMNAAGQLEQLVRQQTAIAKAPYVAAFVEMILQQNTPVILFGYHRSFYEIVTSKLRDYNPLMYTGSETPEKKKEMKDRFCVGDSDLLICSLHSGAGLDGLQHRCATGVHGELDWSPARHQQAEGRYHRDGQKVPCMSYYLVCDYGFDPIMTQVLGVKRAQASGLLQSTDDGVISNQSMKYIKDLANKYINGTA
jgi:SNF2 family DNA or RNA helicase